MNTRSKSPEAIIISLAKHPLFFGTNTSALQKAVSSGRKVTFQKGELLNGDDPSLYFLLKGKAKVIGAEGRADVTRALLQTGSVFGVAQLFMRKGKLSSVVAMTACTCLMIPQEAVEHFLSVDPVFARNYIVFLSDRIRFLNKRITSFTAGKGENMLAAYLLSIPEAADGAVLPLRMSMTSLASSLNVSRPTLYKAFAELESIGAVRRKPGAVVIVSLTQLKSIESRNLS